MITSMAIALLLFEGDGKAEVPQEDPSVVVGHRDHQEALKACAAPVLLRNQSLNSARIDVTLTVEAAGTVRAVAVNAPREMAGVAGCLQAYLKRWTFPEQVEEHSIMVPMFLQGSTR
jgi:hypothetical protein